MRTAARWVAELWRRVRQRGEVRPLSGLRAPPIGWVIGGLGLVMAAIVLSDLGRTCCGDPGPEVSFVPGPTEEIVYAPDCTDVVYVLPSVTSFAVRLDRSEPVDVEVTYRAAPSVDAVEVAEDTELAVSAAEPGVHYAPLPGVVTVPAGSSEAVVDVAVLAGLERGVVGFEVVAVDGEDYQLGGRSEANLVFVSPRADDAPAVDCNPDFQFTDATTNTQQSIQVGEGLTALEATEQVFRASVIGGELPPGIELNDDGSFSGVAGTTGTYVATIQVEPNLHERAVRETTLTTEVLEGAPPTPEVAVAVPPAYCEDPSGALLFRIETSIGYPLEFAEFWSQPEVSLYDDGTLIVTHPETDDLLVSHLSCVERFNVVERAVEAGVRADPPDVGNDVVSDVIADWNTTSFSLRVDTNLVEDQRRQVVVDDTTELFVRHISGEGLEGRLPATRAPLVALRDELRALGVEAGEPYEPVTVSVLVQPTGDDQDVDQAPVGVLVVDWPLGDLAATRGSDEDAWWCGVVAEPDVAALEGRPPAHVGGLRWRSGRKLYQLTFRPDLPDDVPCEW